MPQIDPKFTFWFGVWTNVLLLVASLGVDQAPHVVAQYAPTVQWFCMAFYKINNAILTGLVGLSSTQAGPLIKLPAPSAPTIVKVLILAFLPLVLLAGHSAQAEIRRPHVTGNIPADINADIADQKAAVTAAVTGKSAPSSAALPCMDISMITKLTPENLVPTMKACVQDVNNQLVTDTQRALDSAKAFSGNATGNSAAVGDNDAINCLTPALALFKAAAVIPAVPAQDAVLNPDGSIKTPAVPGTPEIDPGPILLYQKYREFTLAGALTSCQAWFNGPINATASAGIGGVASAAGAAALLAPK
jgi:hypothetical protein